MSVGQPTARGSHVALEALFCGPSTFSRNRPFREKSREIWPFMSLFFENAALGLILGWPTLV